MRLHYPWAMPDARPTRWIALALALALAGPARGQGAGGWRHYGGDAGGQRYVALDEITRANVGRLEIAWTWHSGEASLPPAPAGTAFEATPILVDDTLYVCTPYNRVAALDAETGAERWVFDPEVDPDARYANQLTCRGVEAWRDPAAKPGAACAVRILTATVGARLHALDARTGRPCAGFGDGGSVDLARGVGRIERAGEYSQTSPPVTVGDVVVVGSAVGDNQRIDAPSGVVRGYDARSGALRWAFDLAPPGFVHTPENSSDAGWALATPNVWAPMSVDEARDLVFLPTGNPAPDYFHGGRRPDHYGSSVVALRGSTGEVVWHFQTVHHDLWDFDVPSQPTLTTVVRDGREIPVVVQGTKMGLVFVLHRETGEPIFPVEERPVPQGGVPGERLSPTQPFPVAPPPLVRHAPLAPEEAWGLTPLDRWSCRDRIAALRSDGVYTPPTEKGSLMLPGNAGGTNWGGVAVDPVRRRLVANTMDLAWSIQLVPRAEFDARRAAEPDVEWGPQRGVPYGLRRAPLLSPIGIPCNPPPWGTLAVVDLDDGSIAWQVPLGTVRDIAPVPIAWKLGVPNLGGPLVTRSGLVFVGATMDDYLRAFDLDTGEELFAGRLPAGGQATPMSYRSPSGRQMVVVAAGGHSRAGSRLGDAVVAFALPR